MSNTAEYRLEHLSRQCESFLEYQSMDPFEFESIVGESLVLRYLLFRYLSIDSSQTSFGDALGRSSPNFTSIPQLFVSFPDVELWRFEVVYSFANQQSRSALNFRINRPPTNGSCSISPQNGTTLTRFTVSCLGWFDEDQIKDYSLYRKTMLDWTFVSYSSVQTFDVFFPSGDHQLLVAIRDKRDCVTESNLTTISVRTESLTLSPSSPLDQILRHGDPTTKAQVMNSISQEMNENNLESLRNASSSQ